MYLRALDTMPMNKFLFSPLSLIAALATISLVLPATAAEPSQTEVQPTIASLNAEIAQNPQDAEAYLQRGVIYAQQSQNLPAISDYTQAIRLDPNYVLAYTNRAIAKVNMRDFRGAYQDYTQVIRIQPDRAITYNNRAYARHQLGDCKGAISDLKIAAALFRLQGDDYNFERTLANLRQFDRKR